jgi:hypothetical protein
VTLLYRWVTLRARWVTLRARWVTLRARWVTLRASWVTLMYRWVRFTGLAAARASDPHAARAPLRAAVPALMKVRFPTLLKTLFDPIERFTVPYGNLLVNWPWTGRASPRSSRSALSRPRYGFSRRCTTLPQTRASLRGMAEHAQLGALRHGPAVFWDTISCRKDSSTAGLLGSVVVVPALLCQCRVSDRLCKPV